MALLADKSADVNSNLVTGQNSQTLTFTMPGGVAMKVLSVVATVNNGAATAVTPELTIKDQSGVVIAARKQSSSIPAGDTGTATWALRLDDDAASGGTGGSGIQFDTSPQTGDWLLVTTTGSNAATSNYGARFDFSKGLILNSASGNFVGTLDSEPGYFQLYAQTVSTGYSVNMEASSGTFWRVVEEDAFGGALFLASVGEAEIQSYSTSTAAEAHISVRHAFGIANRIADNTSFLVSADHPFVEFNDLGSGSDWSVAFRTIYTGFGMIATSAGEAVFQIPDDATGVFHVVTGHAASLASTELFSVTGDGNVTATLGAGKTFTVNDSSGNPIFQVDENGDLHGLTGKALTFDL